MRLRFSSLPLLTKILLSTSVALTILFALTGQIVLHNIRQAVSDSLEGQVELAMCHNRIGALLKGERDFPAALKAYQDCCNVG